MVNNRVVVTDDQSDGRSRFRHLCFSPLSGTLRFRVCFLIKTICYNGTFNGLVSPFVTRSCVLLLRSCYQKINTKHNTPFGKTRVTFRFFLFFLKL